jgi:hypothetical protein
VFGEIDEDERRRAGSTEALERSVPRPSPLREQLKTSMRTAYREPRLATLRARADRLYTTFAAQAGA